MPNPFYQIYEGAALLAGGDAVLRQRRSRERATRRRGATCRDAVWARTQLVYVCSPDNPTGRVTTADEWRAPVRAVRPPRLRRSLPTSAIRRSTSTRRGRPLGALAVAHALGRDGFPRLVSFGSLSKRSNAPGLRSGYVAGDAALIRAFLLYRTYHGSAMSPAVAAASIAAWSDEAHVRANRAEYAAKFAALQPRLARGAALRDARRRVLPVGADAGRRCRDFARRLLRREGGDRASRELSRPRCARHQSRAAAASGSRWSPPRAECAEAIERIVALRRREAPVSVPAPRRRCAGGLVAARRSLVAHGPLPTRGRSSVESRHGNSCAPRRTAGTALPALAAGFRISWLTVLLIVRDQHRRSPRCCRSRIRGRSGIRFVTAQCFGLAIAYCGQRRRAMGEAASDPAADRRGGDRHGRRRSCW